MLLIMKMFNFMLIQKGKDAPFLYRRFVVNFLYIVCAVFCLSWYSSEKSYGAEAPAASKPSSVPGYSMDRLTKLADNITKTGRHPADIPDISRPFFLNVSDASLSMDDPEQVFIIKYPDGTVRIYPQRILVWHEVVNDILPDPHTRKFETDTAQYGGDSYTLSYSPYTGSVVAFRSVAGRFPSTFGTSGDLLNSNSVLYDRITGGLWSQLLAVCIDGPLKGKRLERVPVIWATWGGARKVYPEAQVLSRSTGMKRNYGRDPYGSYVLPGSYYDDTRIYYPLAFFDDRLPPKKRMLGVEVGELYGAIEKDAVSSEFVLNNNLGLTPLVSFYDKRLRAVRVFDRRQTWMPEGTPPLSFIFFEDKIVDEQTRSEWNPEGECLYGRLRGKSLKPILAVDTMWFAWYAFHPDSAILTSAGKKTAF